MKKAASREPKISPSQLRQQEFYLTVKDFSSAELEARKVFLIGQHKQAEQAVATLTAALHNTRLDAARIAERIAVVNVTLNNRR